MVAGTLFTQYFLQDGIRQTDAYREMETTSLAQAESRLRALWRALASMPSPSEAETEHEFIFPVLDILGWQYLHQPIADRRRRDVADALLFLTPSAKAASLPRKPIDRFTHGSMIVENEARETRLDRAAAGHESPASQILRYMSRSATHSNGTMRWGLLTNGRTWRLYDGLAPSRAEGFVSFDLADILDPPSIAPLTVPAGAPADHWLRTFLLLFRRQALQADAPEGVTFLELALAEGRLYKARTTAELARAVFEEVFPELVTAIATHDPHARPSDSAWRELARRSALRLLFRLLFLLFAEDRDLLPIRHPGYAHYALRGLRERAAQVADGQLTVSSKAGSWWHQLLALFVAVRAGDTDLGLPPYNGGLFDDEPDDLLPRIMLPDASLARVIEGMSREGALSDRRWINYRDLSVQHLGSIYERILERDVVQDGDGVALRPNLYARKTTGSYYTPEELVGLILRRAVDPLLTERRAAFQAKAKLLASDRRQTAIRLDALDKLDPAEQMLALRICDPAMGSGHFLVSLVDHLTDAILTAMTEAEIDVEWGNYHSPLAKRIVDIRTRILANAVENGWLVPEAQLDDRHIVRRMVLKRCVYGADLNPMAVELAKLSLWLHSFTVGAPLSFLDHHLRCGDSLFGELVGPVVTRLREEYGLAISQAAVSAQKSAAGMAEVEELTDADIAEVKLSRATFEGVEIATRSLRRFLHIYHGARWLPAIDDVDEIGRALFFGGDYGDPVAIAAGKPMRAPRGDAAILRASSRTRSEITAIAAFAAAERFVTATMEHAEASRFLHWEVAFPGVWQNWEEAAPRGGFDAVIGNPPWDRIKMQEVEWWAARQPDVAGHARASDRKVAIAKLRRQGDPLAAEYDRAAARAKQASEVARYLPPKPDRNGKIKGPYQLYPLFARGDINVYSLFLERAGRLVNADGIVGLLVPSGVAADKGAADFFQSISRTGRLVLLCHKLKARLARR